jgi:ElaB/YqjD/DUF883 family membrane-anchored ribosome-binding protein
MSNSNSPESIANGLGIGSSHAAKASRASMSREFHNFLADIEDLVKDTTSMTGEDLTKARAKLNERVAAAKESVEEMGNAFAKRARATATDTNAYVHEQPWKVIGAGAAIGFLLGFVLARR